MADPEASPQGEVGAGELAQQVEMSWPVEAISRQLSDMAAALGSSG